MLQKHGKNPKFVKFRIFKIHNKKHPNIYNFFKKKKVWETLECQKYR